MQFWTHATIYDYRMCDITVGGGSGVKVGLSIKFAGSVSYKYIGWQ